MMNNLATKKSFTKCHLPMDRWWKETSRKKTIHVDIISLFIYTKISIIHRTEKLEFKIIIFHNSAPVV
jgi:hypothetical protein